MSWPGILWRTICCALPRGIALFVGLFTFMNVVGEFRSPRFGANLWWIDLGGNGHFIEPPLLLWSSAGLLWFGTHRRFTPVARILLSITFGLLLAASLWNVIGYFRLLSDGQIHSFSPIPFSAIVALCFGLFLYELFRAMPVSIGSAWLYHLTVAMTCLICGLLFPVAQMVCFGMTDYRRRADVIVVFGAKVYEDGSLSSILEERVQTGCDLYHQGLARQILFSGGPGVGQVYEADGMRTRAIELGVPESAILVDLNGLDTESTAINTLRTGQSRQWNRILAVSQPFHLPRIKLAFHRQGSEVYTVPAKRLYHFRYLPYFMLREVAAWWVYYLRPLG
jgi:vancomycin permeability regulator SanA